ncbi:MAG: hypothetical protein Q9227_009521 [Pyrenula ochraceoflavens]
MDDGVYIERPSSSLSESWATLSTSDVSLDDTQSQNTDHASLLDQSTPEDVHSLTGDESESLRDDDDKEDQEDIDDEEEEEEEEEAVQEKARSISLERSQRSELDKSTANNAQDSLLTTKASSFEPIEFQEPQNWPELGMIGLKHTIRVFDNPETQELLERLVPGLPNQVSNTLLGTARMTMSKRPLDIDRPFRVLYAGDPWVRVRVLRKIAEALGAGRYRHGVDLPATPKTATRSASTFSTILPDHPQLLVDDCLAAVSVQEPGGSTAITLSFKDISLFTSRLSRSPGNKSVYEISSASPWNRPDLAIVAVSSRDTLRQQESNANVQAFARRHQVPAMKVIDDAPWSLDIGNHQIDCSTLHLCLESREQTVVWKTLPVDVDTFENIEPGQLNRNLACVVKIAALSDEEKENYTKKDAASGAHVQEKTLENISMIRGIWQHIIEDNLPEYPLLHKILLHPAFELGLFVCGLSLAAIFCYDITHRTLSWLCYFIVQIFTLSKFMFSFASRTNQSTPSALSVTTHSINLAPQPITKTVYAETSAESSVQSNLQKSLARVQRQMNFAQILSDPAIYAANDSEKFQVQVIGNFHMIVKAPQRLVNQKKPRSFDVTIERENVIINATLSKLFNGVYVVEVDQQEAYGLLNVTVTVVKPFSTETFEVDFGKAWLKPAGWRKAGELASQQLRKDLIAAQENVLKIYGQVSKDFRVQAEKVSKKAMAASGEVQEQSRALVKATTDLIESELKALREATRDHRELRKNVKRFRKDVNKFVQTSSEITRFFAADASRTLTRTSRRLNVAALRSEIMRYSKQLREMGRENLAIAQDRAQKLLKERNIVAEPTKSDKKAKKCGKGHRRKARCTKR